jgi:hypothetical protein
MDHLDQIRSIETPDILMNHHNQNKFDYFNLYSINNYRGFLIHIHKSNNIFHTHNNIYNNFHNIEYFHNKKVRNKLKSKNSSLVYINNCY